jgi:hypothetical protein
VVASDRAFHLLAREEPDTFRKLVALVLPGLLAEGVSVEPEAVDDARFDAPAAVSADFVARVGARDVLHAEFQGYRDHGFVDRLFRYHLALVLRYPTRHVQTIGVWLIRPPPEQRTNEITRSGVTVRVRAIVLPDLPASLLLGSPLTTCFAPAASAEGRSDDELCSLVARALNEQGATNTQIYMAVVAAAAHGRYSAMVDAMQRADFEPVIIEDLVEFGIDQGYERGMREGEQRGLGKAGDAARGQLVKLLQERGFVPTPEQAARISDEGSLARLLDWIARASQASDVGELLDG